MKLSRGYATYSISWQIMIDVVQLHSFRSKLFIQVLNKQLVTQPHILSDLG